MASTLPFVARFLRSRPVRLLAACALGLACVRLGLRVDASGADHRRAGVIYGRKHGMALTLDVLVPDKPKGIGIIWVVGWNWVSDPEAIRPELVKKLIDRGYTVFAVLHSSSPRFTVPEMAADVQRAVRFVRHRAAEFGVDPGRLGAFGFSSGGHLALLQATRGDGPDPGAADPVDRESARVQAAACFFPQTQIAVYVPGPAVVIGSSTFPGMAAPFDFQELDPTENRYVHIADGGRVSAIANSISPLTLVTPDDPPTLLIHGSEDKLCPMAASQEMQLKLASLGIPARLVAVPGKEHGWADMAEQVTLCADWFDEHLGGGHDPARERAPR